MFIFIDKKVSRSFRLRLSIKYWFKINKTKKQKKKVVNNVKNKDWLKENFSLGKIDVT